MSVVRKTAETAPGEAWPTKGMTDTCRKDGSQCWSILDSFSIPKAFDTHHSEDSTGRLGEGSIWRTEFQDAPYYLCHDRSGLRLDIGSPRFTRCERCCYWTPLCFYASHVHTKMWSAGDKAEPSVDESHVASPGFWPQASSLPTT